MKPYLKIKVCGMREPSNVEELKAVQPDYLGLIFYERSPRHVDGEIQELPENIRKTGVFVDASEEFVVEKVKKYGLAAIQLHGNESPEYCRNLKNKISGSKDQKRPVLIKVFGIKEEFDFEVLQPYEDVVDFFLFDTKGEHKGGNGVVFNWELLKNYSSSTPFFLSGGIGQEEIPAIKELYRYFVQRKKEHLFYAVDVNSRFEIAPAEKDIEKIRLFKDSLLS